MPPCARRGGKLGSPLQWRRPRWWYAQHRLDHAPALDAVVQIDAEYPLATDAAVATYEDMTVVQLRHGYAEFAPTSRSEARRRVDRQRQAYEVLMLVASPLVGLAIRSSTTIGSPQTEFTSSGWVPIARAKIATGIGRALDSSSWAWTETARTGAAVVRAFARVRSHHPTTELHLVGGHPPLSEPGVVPHGHLRRSRPAEQEQLDQLYRRATCFVLPSHVEPSAVAYVEAASCGLASIGTRIGGSPDLIGPGGLLVDPSDDEELFQAMVRLCDGGQAAVLGSRARCHASLFTWERVAARILTCLRAPGFSESPLFTAE